MKRPRTGTLRDEEELVISSLAKAYSASWYPGEDPPDAYLVLGTNTVAVEISRLMQPVTDAEGTRSKITDDLPTAALADDINLELGGLIPDGYRIALILRSPILKRSKTKKRLTSHLRTRLADFSSFPTEEYL